MAGDHDSQRATFPWAVLRQFWPYVALIGLGCAGLLLVSASSSEESPQPLFVDEVLKSFGQLPNGTGAEMVWLKIPKAATAQGGLLTAVVCSNGAEVGREVQFAATPPYTYDPRIRVDFDRDQTIDTLLFLEAMPGEVRRDRWVAGEGFKFHKVGQTVVEPSDDLSCPPADQ